MPKEKYRLEVSVQVQYLEDDSDPVRSRYIFGYTIRITNTCDVGVKLLRRHWYIRDADGNLEEVEGEGVVGEQPHLAPGESFEYSSGCALSVPFGSMLGHYLMATEDGVQFQADIPEFFLIGPRTLH